MENVNQQKWVVKFIKENVQKSLEDVLDGKCKKFLQEKFVELNYVVNIKKLVLKENVQLQN